jgi:uncharacterized protein (TIGR02453 family)
VTFEGWPAGAIAWFEGLEADNSKSYFHEHRPIYDESVRGPFEALLAEVADEFGDARVMRPNRDIRFSADKSPYRTYVAGGMARPTGGSYFLRLSADGLGAAAGYYRFAPDQLERYRQAVGRDADGPQLETTAARLRKAGYDVSGHDPLKTVPRGFPKDHPRAELLRYKDLFAWRHQEPGPWLASRDALDWVTDTWRTAAPLLAWLDQHVGPTTEPEAPRRR